MKPSKKRTFRLHRFAEQGWDGLTRSAYKDHGGDFRGISRTVFPAAEEQRFEVRYFEFRPGGFSSYERHDHSHTVIVLRGSGTVLLDREAVCVVPHDHLLIGPGTLHRFIASGDEPFGFLCIVDAKRDRPRPIGEEELAELAEHPVLGPILRGIEE